MESVGESPAPNGAPDGAPDAPAAAIELRVSRHLQAHIAVAMQGCLELNVDVNAGRRSKEASVDPMTGLLFIESSRSFRVPTTARPAMAVGRNFPVPVMPGQFADAYAVYTPHQLCHLPLETSTRKLPRQAPIRTDKETLQPIRHPLSQPPVNLIASEREPSHKKRIDESPMALSALKRNKLPPGFKCVQCERASERTPIGTTEGMIICSTCGTGGHPSCLDMSVQLASVALTYGWECLNCKSCGVCQRTDSEDQLLMCDVCDRGFHATCVGLHSLPLGRWICTNCTCCTSCGTRDPGGDCWKMEFLRSSSGGEPRFIHTLCVSCSRSFNKGEYCPVCLRIYNDKTRIFKCFLCQRHVHPSCDPGFKRPRGRIRYDCPLCRGEQKDPLDVDSSSDAPKLPASGSVPDLTSIAAGAAEGGDEAGTAAGEGSSTSECGAPAQPPRNASYEDIPNTRPMGRLGIAQARTKQMEKKELEKERALLQGVGEGDEKQLAKRAEDPNENEDNPNDGADADDASRGASGEDEKDGTDPEEERKTGSGSASPKPAATPAAKKKRTAAQTETDDAAEDTVDKGESSSGGDRRASRSSASTSRSPASTPSPRQSSRSRATPKGGSHPLSKRLRMDWESDGDEDNDNGNDNNDNDDSDDSSDDSPGGSDSDSDSDGASKSRRGRATKPPARRGGVRAAPRRAAAAAAIARNQRRSDDDDSSDDDDDNDADADENGGGDDSGDDSSDPSAEDVTPRRRSARASQFASQSAATPSSARRSSGRNASPAAATPTRALRRR